MVAIRVPRNTRPKRKKHLKHAPKLKEVLKASGHAKKSKNISNDIIYGKVGKIYIPDQEISKIALTRDVRGLKRKRRDAKKKKEHSKKHKVDPE